MSCAIAIDWKFEESFPNFRRCSHCSHDMNKMWVLECIGKCLGIAQYLGVGQCLNLGIHGVLFNEVVMGGVNLNSTLDFYSLGGIILFSISELVFLMVGEWIITEMGVLVGKFVQSNGSGTSCYCYWIIILILFCLASEIPLYCILLLGVLPMGQLLLIFHLHVHSLQQHNPFFKLFFTV